MHKLTYNVILGVFFQKIWFLDINQIYSFDSFDNFDFYVSFVIALLKQQYLTRRGILWNIDNNQIYITIKSILYDL